MPYDFGKVILDSYDKGKRTSQAAHEIKMRKEQMIKDDHYRAKVLSESIENRKQTNEIQKAVNELKKDQMEANLTGKYNGQNTWARNVYEESQTSDLSPIKALLNDSQLAMLEKSGVDLSKVHKDVVSLVPTLLSPFLSRHTKSQDIARSMLPPKAWENPEGGDEDWGLGIDQSEIVHEAKDWLKDSKKDIARWREVGKSNPNDAGYQSYVKQLKSLQRDLDSTQYFPHDEGTTSIPVTPIPGLSLPIPGRRNLPANVKARKMSKEITELLAFLEG